MRFELFISKCDSVTDVDGTLNKVESNIPSEVDLHVNNQPILLSPTMRLFLLV